MGLEPKAAKTRIVHLQDGGQGLDFLGFHHRLVRARGRQGTKRVTFLARPSHRATQHARDRIRALTARSRLLIPFEQVVQEVNRFLRGWAGYFRIGNSARMFDKIMTYTVDRIALFVAKLHKRHGRYGWAMFRLSPDRLGLITLNGTVVAPRPNRAWRALVAEHRQ
jgi:RNA-directed DNA polymerase